jgi:hypothetical protein
MTQAKPMTDAEAANLESARQYYIRGDAGRADTLDLFTDDVQIFFPKFGITHGKAGFGELAAGLLGSVSTFAHDLSTFTWTVAQDTVVVEGTTYGTGGDGRQWRGGETPGGRFCSVFIFRDGLIARMHIYLDPDYTSQDTERFLWGRDRAW